MFKEFEEQLKKDLDNETKQNKLDIPKTSSNWSWENGKYYEKKSFSDSQGWSQTKSDNDWKRFRFNFNEIIFEMNDKYAFLLRNGWYTWIYKNSARFSKDRTYLIVGFNLNKSIPHKIFQWNKAEKRNVEKDISNEELRQIFIVTKREEVENEWVIKDVLKDQPKKVFQEPTQPTKQSQDINFELDEI